jgi:Fur family ferric uptake transcriptional regulator
MQHHSHDCSDELHQASLRVTPVRLAILHAFETTDEPLDVASIEQMLKRQHIRADKVTLFRTVNALSEKGIVVPIQLNEGKMRYEYANREDHHHFVCDRCGDIQDIPGCAARAAADDLSKHGITVSRHTMEFFGLCADCAKPKAGGRSI